MQAINNVVRLEQGDVFSFIKSYLRSRGNKSSNTETAYENDLHQFFKYMRNKDLEELTETDLYFKNADIQDYQTYLYRDFKQPNGERYRNTTINRKLNAIVSLYGYFQRNDFNVDARKMKVDDLADDTRQIGFLEVDEVETLLILTDNEELRAFIMLALRTSMRKAAMVNLEWNQINKIHEKEDMYRIVAFDKGKQIEREIHQSMYDVLLTLKIEGSSRVFQTNERMISYYFDCLCKKAGIDPKRKISIHSLKKAGVSLTRDLFDLHTAQMQANHSSIHTTGKSYLPKATNVLGTVLDVKIEDNIFDDMSHEELLRLVKGTTNGLKHKLKMDAKKIVDARR